MKIRGLHTMLPVRPGLTHPGQVDEYFARAFEFNQIVSKDRMVADIRQLHPMAAGIRLVEEKEWESVEQRGDRMVYALRNPEQPHGFQMATFDYASGGVELVMGFVAFRQWIAMDKEGRVIRDSGRVII